MATITFAQIDRILIEHRRAEEARNAPASVACRALETLRDALAELDPGERSEIADELRTLIAEFDAVAWCQFGAALATQEG